MRPPEPERALTDLTQRLGQVAAAVNALCHGDPHACEADLLADLVTALHGLRIDAQNWLNALTPAGQATP